MTCRILVVGHGTANGDIAHWLDESEYGVVGGTTDIDVNSTGLFADLCLHDEYVKSVREYPDEELVPAKQSWQSLNKGKFNKKQRRSKL